MRRIFLTALLIAASSVVSSADIRHDGNWWQTQGDASKATYIGGFFDGMYLGGNFAIWKYINGTKAQVAATAQASEAYDDYIKRYFSNVTVGQIKDGLDGFYADFRNRRILIHGAIWLVSNGIAGTPEEEIKRLTESWRKSAVE